jgi:(Z)-2-((N-methylformamido)methylene)-5-hydroxybutyrolactone dehydrogenase
MTAELGGKSAMVICADCDVERAVEGVLAGGFIASGQTCVTGSRIIVQEEIYEPFVERLVQRTGELKIGRPWEFETQIGAVIDAEAVRRCERYISTAEKEGARILAGGKAVQVDGKVFSLSNGRLIVGILFSTYVTWRL